VFAHWFGYTPETTMSLTNDEFESHIEWLERQMDQMDEAQHG